jgi:signal transduction histidine kinase
MADINKQKELTQFRILREMALAVTEGSITSETTEQALKESVELVGLAAATLILWDKNFNPILNVTYSDDENHNRLLSELENDLFARLRKDKKLVSAYLSFGGNNPYSGFTLPVKINGEVLGAVIGIQLGQGSLVKEDFFLETLAATLSVSVYSTQIEARIEKSRRELLDATAATVNHEINNLLQAILGTVQLLGKDEDKFDEATKKKLKLVEQSSLAIMNVTRRLMNISKIRYTDYIDGTKMLDISTNDAPT